MGELPCVIFMNSFTPALVLPSRRRREDVRFSSVFIVYNDSVIYLFVYLSMMIPVYGCNCAFAILIKLVQTFLILKPL